MMPQDPERRLALAYAPAARRAGLGALWALDEQFARIVATARDPAIGQLKLAWWRDALAALDTRPPPAEPLLRALAADVLPAGVRGVELAAMAEGWDALLPPDQVDDAALAAHGADRGERLFALAGRMLGGDVPAGIGADWAMRDARARLPGIGASRGAAAGSSAGAGRRWTVALRPLGMIDILSRRDPGERPGSPARLLRMLRHRLTGR